MHENTDFNPIYQNPTKIKIGNRTHSTTDFQYFLTFIYGLSLT